MDATHFLFLEQEGWLTDRSFFVHCVSFVLSRSAAGGTGGEGGVNVKLLAEQNMQLKEGLKRLHTRSIAEKTDVGTLF